MKALLLFQISTIEKTFEGEYIFSFLRNHSFQMNVQPVTLAFLISSETIVFWWDEGKTADPPANKAPHIPKVP
jgi:hypothetical protein